MTPGVVHDLQARVNVVFRLPGRPDLAIECVVDTGFAGALTLPPSAVAPLGLPFFQEIDANLANDADVKTSVHVATIVWDGREVEVAVLAMGRRPLRRGRRGDDLAAPVTRSRLFLDRIAVVCCYGRAGR